MAREAGFVSEIADLLLCLWPRRMRRETPSNLKAVMELSSGLREGWRSRDA